MSKSFVPKAFETACGAAVAAVVLFFAAAPQSAQGAAKWIIGGNGCSININGGHCITKKNLPACLNLKVNSCDKAANTLKCVDKPDDDYCTKVLCDGGNKICQ